MPRRNLEKKTNGGRDLKVEWGGVGGGGRDGE